MGYPAGWPDFKDAKPMKCCACGGITFLDRPDPVKKRSYGFCQHCGQRRLMRLGVVPKSMANAPSHESVEG